MQQSQELCEANGLGVWKKKFYNYDNIFEALLSLFIILTGNGWVEQYQ